MTRKEIVKHYEKDAFRVVWKPAKCIHSEICIKTLPKVYLPDEKPWIRPEAASIQDLKNQINRCPSGALSYEIKDLKKEAGLIPEATEIQVLPGGPLLVKGSIKLTGADGTIQEADGNTALCRCGGSQNKPYCDGSHKTLNFE
ncbi:(4Fe-4S)-binding protein [Robiginitalea sp.]|uniref:(4Fe-4S)-binding protein n=1 Tax=Robiginitalea sp. TaxID=1902411 RepID=UPI003C70FA34